MIKLIQQGTYELLETINQTKILILDKQKIYAWVNVKDIGEILVTSHKVHETDTVLAQGMYRLFEVKNEKRYTNVQHLELSLGEDRWQGYLLLTGLPTDEDIRNRIIPTSQILQNN